MRIKNQSLLARLRFAWAGLLYGLRAEHSLRIQASVFLIVVAALIWLRPGTLWWALVLLASGGVFSAELFNTTLEHLADHLHPEMHPQIRVVKDCAAAAVLVAAFGALAVGIALAIHLLRRG